MHSYEDIIYYNDELTDNGGISNIIKTAKQYFSNNKEDWKLFLLMMLADPEIFIKNTKHRAQTSHSLAPLIRMAHLMISTDDVLPHEVPAQCMKADDSYIINFIQKKCSVIKIILDLPPVLAAVMHTRFLAVISKYCFDCLRDEDKEPPGDLQEENNKQEFELIKTEINKTKLYEYTGMKSILRLYNKQPGVTGYNVLYFSWKKYVTGFIPQYWLQNVLDLSTQAQCYSNCIEARQSERYEACMKEKPFLNINNRTADQEQELNEFMKRKAYSWINYGITDFGQTQDQRADKILKTHPLRTGY